MHQGELRQTGAPLDLYRQPNSRFVAEFLGDVNWFDGVGVRPEAVRVARTAPLNENHSTSGVVQHTTFLGNCVHLKAKLADGADCLAELPQRTCDFQPGETVFMWWHETDEFRIPAGDSK